MLDRFLALAATLAAPFAFAAPALAQQDLITAEIRPGWRSASGVHRAGLVLTMAPGWKTYWRAPGDAGIPPLISWDGSENLQALSIDWPTPKIDWTDGFRSIVYENQVVLPLSVHPQTAGDVTLTGTLQLGVCADICVPAFADVAITLPGDVTKPDPVIASAMADVPLTEAEAEVAGVSCTVSPDPKGLRLAAAIQLPSAGKTEAAVIETADPEIWVSVPKTHREGAVLHAEALLIHIDRGPFALDRSGIRITVLGSDYAVDVQGCS